jgi:hypothetical protein
MDRKFELKVKSFGGPRKSASSARLFPDGSMASWPVPLLKVKPHAVSFTCPVKPTFGGENDAIATRICDSHFDRDGAFDDFNSVWFIGTCSHMRQRRAKMYRSSEG